MTSKKLVFLRALQPDGCIYDFYYPSFKLNQIFIFDFIYFLFLNFILVLLYTFKRT